MDMNRLLTADLTGAQWWKASASSGGNNDCVETALIADGAELLGMGVRDSKDPHGPVLRFSADAWTAFTDSIDRGDFPV